MHNPASPFLTLRGIPMPAIRRHQYASHKDSSNRADGSSVLDQEVCCRILINGGVFLVTPAFFRQVRSTHVCCH